MELETSVSKWFEENGLSIEDYRDYFVIASIDMMKEAGNVSKKARDSVTRALESYNELIEVCAAIIINESYIEDQKNNNGVDHYQQETEKHSDEQDKRFSEIMSEIKAINKHLERIARRF